MDLQSPEILAVVPAAHGLMATLRRPLFHHREETQRDPPQDGTLGEGPR